MQQPIFAEQIGNTVVDVFVYSKEHEAGSRKPYWGKIIPYSWRSPIQGRPVLLNSQSAALIHPNAIMELISCLYFPRHFTHMTVDSGTHSGNLPHFGPLMTVLIHKYIQILTKSYTQRVTRGKQCTEACM